MIDIEAREAFQGKRALITGGLGFIGSNLARRLIRLGVTVSIVDSANPETGANTFNLVDTVDEIEITIADVRNTQKMDPLVRGKDFLFNLAGLSSHVEGMHKPVDDLEVNALAQLQLLELCRNINPEIRIVYSGTRQVYGRFNQVPVDENAFVMPVDYNGISKLAGGLYHILCNHIYGLWTTSLRLTNTYGPRMRVRDSRQTFIGLWIRLLMDGERFVVFGTGEQVRDFNYVDDVVDALLLAVTKPAAQGKIYNLGAEPNSLLKIADLLISLNGGGQYSLQPFPDERLKIDIKDYAGDYSKIHTELGWKPSTLLEDGLRQTLEFYRLNRVHYW